jgi:hypothetical protein
MRRAAVLVMMVALTHLAEAGPKKRDTARILSGSAAALSGVVVGAGFMTAEDGHPFNKPVLYTGIGLLAITPSAGELYAGQYVTIGMGIRVVGAAFASWIFSSHVESVVCDNGTSSADKCEQLDDTAPPLLGVAAIIYIGGIWYDVLDAGDAADRYNTSHGYALTPTALRGPQGMAPGLALTGSF